jgi:hypothetical protein
MEADPSALSPQCVWARVALIGWKHVDA